MRTKRVTSAVAVLALVVGVTLFVLPTAATAATAAAVAATAAPAAAPPSYVGDRRHTPQLTPAAWFGTAGAECPKVVAYVSRGAGENADQAASVPGAAQPGDAVPGSPATRSTYFGGAGEELSPLLNHLGELYGPDLRTVASLPAGASGGPGYPAVGVEVPALLNWTLPAKFMDSIHTGAQQVILDLNAIHAACPGSSLVVAG